jgi:hypothetical protein
MKIIISESQLKLLKETSYVDMDEEQLYDRAVKLKDTVDRRVSKELSKFYWFDNLETTVDWGYLGPEYHFLINANDKISDDSLFYNRELKYEVYVIIEDIFKMYFPDGNKHTKYNQTGLFNVYFYNSEGEVNIFFEPRKNNY